MWTANKYISSELNNGGKTRVPTLHVRRLDGTTTKVNSNHKKSTIIAVLFFPLPLANDFIPPDALYPDPVASPFTSAEITHPSSNSVGIRRPGWMIFVTLFTNNVLVSSSSYLMHLFNAIFTLRTYYELWKKFTMVVLHKPEKLNYTVPKVFCPITLLNTLDKLLSAVVAERLTFTLEQYHLLLNTHFEGRPGRYTTDSLHLLEEIVKNAWRSHKVASVLFLDIKGAFLNAVLKYLIHTMHMRHIPGDIVSSTK